MGADPWRHRGGRIRAGECLLAAGIAWGAGAPWAQATPTVQDTPPVRPHALTIPPIFDAETCLLEVDRSQSAMATFVYDILLEDPPPPEPPLPDAPSHQFFAMCKSSPPTVPLPNRTDDDDVQRAQDAGLIMATPPPEEVLATAPRWSEGHDGTAGTCVHAVTPKSARRSVVCAEVSPVVWDTSAAPAGAYLIQGYTFDPSDTSEWSLRFGVVWVHDGDRSAVGRAAALQFALPGVSTKLYEENVYPLRGCVAGMDGTVATVEWALGTDTSTWNEIAAFPADPASCAFEVPFDPPAQTVGQTLVVRVRAEDPMGRTFVALAGGTLSIFPGDGPPPKPRIPELLGACDVKPLDPVALPECPPLPGQTGTSGGSGSGTGGGLGTTGAATGSPPLPIPADDGSGCACRLPPVGGGSVRPRCWPGSCSRRLAALAGAAMGRVGPVASAPRPLVTGG